MARKPVRNAAAPRRKARVQTASGGKRGGKKAAAAAKAAPRRVATARKKPAGKKKAGKKKAALKKPAKKKTAAATAKKRTAGAPGTAKKAAARKTGARRPASTTAARAGRGRAGTGRTTSSGVPTPPSSLDMNRRGSAARTGRAELAEARENFGSMQALTGGDVDVNAENAYFSGDEAPGGDNPTPDQDIVDDIGRALGVEYQDSEELRGSDKVSARDKHRWELDPASAEDYKNRR